MSTIDRGLTTVLLDAVTATATSRVAIFPQSKKTPYLGVAGTGTVSATAQFWGSALEDKSFPQLLLTISVTGTTSASDYLQLDNHWPVLWSVLTAISGTGAAATAGVMVQP